MVEQLIDSIFGAICITIAIAVSVISHQPFPTKDTSDSANTDSQTTQNNPLPSTTTNKYNNQLLGAFTGTSRKQLSHYHPHHGDAAPSSDTAATFLAPKPGHGTNNAGGLQHVQNHSRQHCPPASLVHWEHNIIGE
eukprot:10816361-Ditylum_brightwellii.AAC.1